MRRTKLAVALALVNAVALVVAGGAVVRHSDPAAPPAPTAPVAAPPPAVAPPVDYRPGAAARVVLDGGDTFDVRVVQTFVRRQGRKASSARPRNGYYLVAVLAYRIRTGNVDITPMSWRAEDQVGRQFQVGTDNARRSGFADNLGLATVVTGTRLLRQVVFDVSGPHGTITYSSGGMPLARWRY